jgi:hypothetical protein
VPQGYEAKVVSALFGTDSVGEDSQGALIFKVGGVECFRSITPCFGINTVAYVSFGLGASLTLPLQSVIDPVTGVVTYLATEVMSAALPELWFATEFTVESSCAPTGGGVAGNLFYILRKLQ